MRLSEKEQHTIKSCLANIDPEASVYLFGSRTDDTAKGGDIDLLIYSEDFGFERVASYRWTLMEQLGEQKFDLVVASDKNQTFVATIKEGALRL